MSVMSILLLCGAAKPESGILHLVNDTIDLGDVPQDSVASAPLPVTNTGNAPLSSRRYAPTAAAAWEATRTLKSCRATQPRS